MKAVRSILSAVLVTAFVAALSGCGQSGISTEKTEPDQTTTQSSTVTTTTTTTTTTATTPARSSLDLYMDTIANYGQGRIDSMAEWGYSIDMPEYEYAIRDVNGDGTDELIIHELPEYADTIGAIYTLDGDQPVELYFMGRHGNYTISADGYFVYFYHTLTLEKLVGTELVFIAESERLGDEYGDGEVSAFFKANGVSEDDMTFDYTRYSG